MSGMLFSIHQDLWQDCWVAATSAARSKKKQVDWSIQQRVHKLMEEYGPGTGMPLSLRVYGTMLKGFCVINNDRARSLHADCERLVVACAQQPGVGESRTLKSVPAKRKHIDALTLDLDLSKVREAEGFDWAPLEEGMLLQLPSQPGGGAPSQDLHMSQSMVLRPPLSLLAHGDLLDESFPAIDAAPTEAVDMTAPLPLVSAGLLAAGECVEEQLMVEDGGGAAVAVALPQAPLAARVASDARAAHARALKLLRRLEPGRVFGFDEQGTIPANVWDVWGRDDGDISMPVRGPACFAEVMQPRTMSRFGHMDVLLELARREQTREDRGHGSSWGSVPTAILAGTAPEQMGGDVAAFQVVGAGLDDNAALDPFRPCLPAPPLAAASGADAELANAFVVGHASQDAEASEQRRKRKHGQGAAATYDDQAVRVGDVIRRYVTSAVGGDRCVTLDDLLPAGKTDQATAARTFHALLTLATAGEFRVAQPKPYMPIEISVAA